MKQTVLSFSKLSLFLAIGAVGFTSCGDDDDNGGTPVNKTRTQLLIENSWRQTGYTQTTNGQTTDLFGGDACDLDALMKLNAANNNATNGTYELNEGASKCDPDAPQVYATGTWAFSGTNDVVVTDSDGDSQTLTILELTDNSLKLREPGPDSTIYYTATYVAQ